MNKEDLLEIKKIATEASDEAAKKAVAQMREFHLDDIKVLGERMDMGFESVDRRFVVLESKMNAGFENVDKRFNEIEIRVERVENALQVLLDEFKKHRNEVDELKRKNLELTQRVQVLERELASMK